MEHAWCRDVARDAAVRAAEDGRTAPLPTLGEAIAAPFAEAAERSVPVSKTGEGQSGLRTERITLEVTHGEYYCLPEWSWATILRLHPGESVRVVEDCCLEQIKKRELIRQRDAAIRERDALRASAITQALTADRFASAVAEADTLRARVAELEAASGGGPEGNG